MNRTSEKCGTPLNTPNIHIIGIKKDRKEKGVEKYSKKLWQKISQICRN